MATTYLDMGDAEKALAELQTYFTEQRQSKGRDAYELLAKILEKLGKSNELVERLEKIAEEDARNTALQYYLADQYRLAGMLDKAEPLYKKMLASDPRRGGFRGVGGRLSPIGQDDELLDTLAKGFGQEGDIKAIDAEIKLLATDPKIVDTLVESGRKLKADGARNWGSSRRTCWRTSPPRPDARNRRSSSTGTFWTRGTTRRTTPSASWAVFTST